MTTLELVKYAIKDFSFEELNELKDMIDSIINDKDIVIDEIKRLWQTEGKIPAVIFFQKSKLNTDNFGLMDSKKHVEEICKGLELPYNFFN